jgi:hypothetical protein
MCDGCIFKLPEATSTAWCVKFYTLPEGTVCESKVVNRRTHEQSSS